MFDVTSAAAKIALAGIQNNRNDRDVTMKQDTQLVSYLSREQLDQAVNGAFFQPELDPEKGKENKGKDPEVPATDVIRDYRESTDRLIDQLFSKKATVSRDENPYMRDPIDVRKYLNQGRQYDLDRTKLIELGINPDKPMLLAVNAEMSSAAKSMLTELYEIQLNVDTEHASEKFKARIAFEMYQMHESGRNEADFWSFFAEVDRLHSQAFGAAAEIFEALMNQNLKEEDKARIVWRNLNGADTQMAELISDAFITYFPGYGTIEEFFLDHLGNGENKEDLGPLAVNLLEGRTDERVKRSFSEIRTYIDRLKEMKAIEEDFSKAGAVFGGKTVFVSAVAQHFLEERNGLLLELSLTGLRVEEQRKWVSAIDSYQGVENIRDDINAKSYRRDALARLYDAYNNLSSSAQAVLDEALGNSESFSGRISRKDLAALAIVIPAKSDNPAHQELQANFMPVFATVVAAYDIPQSYLPNKEHGLLSLVQAETKRGVARSYSVEEVQAICREISATLLRMSDGGGTDQERALWKHEKLEYLIGISQRLHAASIDGKLAFQVRDTLNQFFEQKYESAFAHDATKVFDIAFDPKLVATQIKYTLEQVEAYQAGAPLTLDEAVNDNLRIQSILSQSLGNPDDVTSVIPVLPENAYQQVEKEYVQLMNTDPTSIQAAFDWLIAERYKQNLVQITAEDNSPDWKDMKLSEALTTDFSQSLELWHSNIPRLTTERSIFRDNSAIEAIKKGSGAAAALEGVLHQSFSMVATPNQIDPIESLITGVQHPSEAELRKLLMGDDNRPLSEQIDQLTRIRMEFLKHQPVDTRLEEYLIEHSPDLYHLFFAQGLHDVEAGVVQRRNAAFSQAFEYYTLSGTAEAYDRCYADGDPASAKSFRAMLVQNGLTEMLHTLDRQAPQDMLLTLNAGKALLESMAEGEQRTEVALFLQRLENNHPTLTGDVSKHDELLLTMRSYGAPTSIIEKLSQTAPELQARIEKYSQKKYATEEVRSIAQQWFLYFATPEEDRKLQDYNNLIKLTAGNERLQNDVVRYYNPVYTKVFGLTFEEESAALQ